MYALTLSLLLSCSLDRPTMPVERPEIEMNTIVTLDGRPATIDDLEDGMTVTVTSYYGWVWRIDAVSGK